MLTLKIHKFFFNTSIIIFYILILFFATSCSLKMPQKKSFFLKKLIIPKDINFPSQDKEYYIPYTQDDLNKKNYDIFPPEIK
ncbi:hypothetical protein DD681_02570 [Buchnera aphidicola (Melanaphis sacchari)]|uniref:Outer membrane protein assembly factor BamC n=1 Tax=Buchnera aphidicola (Melanaphis sacchari) TaxID=2173854 RepID=A0A2U8DFT8_9GAMM|nr:hypothetical protein DD681_02570 [Buchnera aphidicola (Melanaphis sacchari)]